MERADFQRWLDGYAKAWRSDEPDDVAAIFTEDAIYLTGPFDAPWNGRDEIVAKWIENGDSKASVDFELRPIGVDGDLGVFQGTTTYHATDEHPERVYGNVWLVRLAADGRATHFTEYWMLRRS